MRINACARTGYGRRVLLELQRKENDTGDDADVGENRDHLTEVDFPHCRLLSLMLPERASAPGALMSVKHPAGTGGARQFETLTVSLCRHEPFELIGPVLDDDDTGRRAITS